MADNKTGPRQPKPGSAADLLSVLESHRSEWDRKVSRRAAAEQERRRRQRQRHHHHPYQQQQPQQQIQQPSPPLHRHHAPPQHFPKPQKHQSAQKQKQAGPRSAPAPPSLTALGLSGNHRSREITSRVVAAYSHAEAQLRSPDLSYQDKLDSARRCILSFHRLARLPLSDINISAILHRICRLVSHDSLKPTATAPSSYAQKTSSVPDIGQGPLMREVLAEVASRAAGQQRRLVQQVVPPPLKLAASSNDNALKGRGRKKRHHANNNATTASTKCISQYGLSFGSDAPPPDELHESTAALALYSSGIIGMRLPPAHVDILAHAVLSARPAWSDQRIVMVSYALGKKRIIPLEGALHRALQAEAEHRMRRLSPEELSTLLWGFSHAGYQPGEDFLVGAMAALGEKVDELPDIGVSSTLDALSGMNWVPPAPASAIAKAASKEWWTREEEGLQKEEDEEEEEYYSNSSLLTVNTVRTRELRELQRMAREWERERRQGLAQLLSSSSSLTSTSMTEMVPRVGTDSSSTNTSLLASFARQAVKAREQRHQAAQLGREVTRLVQELRDTVRAQQEVVEEDYAGRKKEDEDALVNKLLTGTWPSSSSTTGTGDDEDTTTTHTRGMAVHMSSTNEDEEKVEGRRIYRLGDALAAEALVQPASGRTVIQPHYDRSLLFGSSSELVFDDMLTSYGRLLELEDEEDTGNGVGNIVATPSSLPAPAPSSSSSFATVPRRHAALPASLLSLPTELSSAAAETLQTLVSRATQRIRFLRPDQTVKNARYVSALRHVDRDLLLAVRHNVEKHLLSTSTSTSTPPEGRRLSSIVVADFLWSFAYLGVDDLMPIQTSTMAMEVAMNDPQYSPYALGKSVWALAVLGHLDPGILIRSCLLIVQALKRERERNLHGSSSSSLPRDEDNDDVLSQEQGEDRRSSTPYAILLKQVFQAALSVQGKYNIPLEDLLPPELRHEAAAAWNDRGSSLQTSFLQRYVAAAVTSAGLPCELEYCPPGSNVVIDVAIFMPRNSDDNDSSKRVPNTKIALEVDGPSHFATNVLDHPLGAMKLRNSLLQSSGWRVVTVPYFEWEMVKPKDRVKYIESKIN